MNLNTAIHRFLLHYRSTPHTTTGKSPAELLFNRKINTRLNLLKNSLNKQYLKQEEDVVEFYNSKKLRTSTLGDTVWYRNYQKGNKWERGVVIKQTGPVTYLINNYYSTLQKHVDQLRMGYINTDVETDNGNLEKTLDNPVLNEHENNLEVPDNEKEIELQNKTLLSPTQLYSQPNISPEISNPPKTPTLQAPQSHENENENSTNTDDLNPTQRLRRSQRVRNPPPYLKDYAQ